MKDDQALVGAAVGYAKSHSHAEFVYDWQWAGAVEASGRAYYPKFFFGAPFTPATGDRLLGDKEAMAAALIQWIDGSALRSAHANCIADDDRPALERQNFLFRPMWQYHWINRHYQTFDDFLGQLKRKPRKNIRAERRQLHASGYETRWISALAASDDDLAAMYRFYVQTFAEKGNWAPLTRAFFADIRQLGETAQLCLAYAPRTESPMAGALFFQSNEALYGRYWGADQPVRHLHFEVCFYRAIEHCIAHGLSRFEPGAFGEHKLSRGFEPVQVNNAHYFSDPSVRDGIRRSLAAASENFRAEGEYLRGKCAIADVR